MKGIYTRNAKLSRKIQSSSLNNVTLPDEIVFEFNDRHNSSNNNNNNDNNNNIEKSNDNDNNNGDNNDNTKSK